MDVSSRPPTERPLMRADLLRQAARVRRHDVVVAAVLYSTHQLGEALVPVLVGAAIGRAVATGSPAALVVWAALLIADFAVLSLSYRFGARAATRAAQHGAHALRVAVVRRTLDPAGGGDLAPGELLARASIDADRVGAAVGLLASSVAAAAAVLAGSAFLFVTAPALGVVVVAGTLGVLAATAAASRRLAARSMSEQEAAADATVAATDLVHGLRALAGIGAGPAAAARYAHTSRSATTAAERAAASAAGIDGVAALLTGLYLAVVVGMAGWLALSHGLTVAQLVSALGLAVFLSGPLQRLTAAPGALSRAGASAQRLAEVLNRTEAASRPPATTAAEPVAPAAPGGDGPDLAPDLEIVAGGWSFTAAGGALTGVVTRHPSVAARLVAALARERDDPTTRVSVGGHDLTALPLGEARRRVLVAPHDAAVFDATVGENIVLGGHGVSRDEAAAAAFADEIVAGLPDGWDTPAGDGGRRLSGGQRQRVALARAIAADADVLVLHDPTTAVDPVTEELIAQRLRTLRAGRTTIVVTTSPALLARCDTVVLLDAETARTGTHEDLTRADGAYREVVAR